MKLVCVLFVHLTAAKKNKNKEIEKQRIKKINEGQIDPMGSPGSKYKLHKYTLWFFWKSVTDYSLY